MNGTRLAVRRFCQQAKGAAGAGAAVRQVPGLSAAVVRPAAPTEGPGVQGDKSGAYKVPEYFCYNTISYYEAEVEMAKHRLPQPSALSK